MKPAVKKAARRPPRKGRQQIRKTIPLRVLLESVELHRFKAAFEPDAVALAPFTSVIGRNGSGKSTLLEGLQWLDVALRHDAARASERYGGLHDLLNISGRGRKPNFKLSLTWKVEPKESDAVILAAARYEVSVSESRLGNPLIRSESLVVSVAGLPDLVVVSTEKIGNAEVPGVRVLFPSDPERRRVFREPERLALSRVEVEPRSTALDHRIIAALSTFWENAVFLRLSPQQISQGSSLTRRSFDPILDEEGKMLPALLNELSRAQKQELVEALKVALPDVRGISVSEPTSKRDEAVSWSLQEHMQAKYKGKKERPYEIPASMLSEGTRRLTAILALLLRRPPPTLLCIEEIENGLDPWTVLDVLARLQAAPLDGTQVLITSHSPWLLDHMDLDAIRISQRERGQTRYASFRDKSEAQKFLAAVPPGARYVNLIDPER